MAVRVVRLRRVVAAAPPDVFALAADHEGYAFLPGVRGAKLLRAGAGERNGLGAEREISLSFGRVIERVVAFEPPRHLGYRILAAPFPIDHLGTDLYLREVAGGTEVEWCLRYRARFAIGAKAVEAAAGLAFYAAIAATLAYWARTARARHPGWHQALPPAQVTSGRPPAPQAPARGVPGGGLLGLARALTRPLAWPLGLGLGLRLLRRRPPPD